MSDNKKNKQINPKSKNYLDKSFLEELSYKVWTTKGARFEADKRLTKTSRMSSISLSIFSAYLIIASLISVYISNYNINFQIINYFVTALSIILLVLSQFESSQDYKLRANNFHKCGLELSKIYNEIRIFKTLCLDAKNEEIAKFCKRMSYRYQNVLEGYENHIPLDYNNFKISHREYFEEIKKKEVMVIKFWSFWLVYGWYSLLLIVTPVIFICLSYISRK